MIRFTSMLHLSLFLLLAVTAGGCGYHPQRNAAAFDPVLFEVEYDEAGRMPPQATLPTRIVVARVGYPSQSPVPSSTHATDEPPDRPRGTLQVMRTPEAAVVGPIRNLAQQLPGVRDVVVLQPEMAPERITGPESLRRTARRFGADLLVIYSLATNRGDNFRFPELSYLTLGFAPNATGNADATVRAALIDTATGHVFERYAAYHDDWHWSFTSYYTINEARDRAEYKATVKAMTDMVEQIEESWPRVTQRVRASATGVQ